MDNQDKELLEHLQKIDDSRLSTKIKRAYKDLSSGDFEKRHKTKLTALTAGLIAFLVLIYVNDAINRDRIKKDREFDAYIKSSEKARNTPAVIGSGSSGDTWSGWIMPSVSVVSDSPDGSGNVVGFIAHKASVTVKRSSPGWSEIVFAPIREANTNQLGSCPARCYIRSGDVSETIPKK